MEEPRSTDKIPPEREKPRNITLPIDIDIYEGEEMLRIEHALKEGGQTGDGKRA